MNRPSKDGTLLGRCCTFVRDRGSRRSRIVLIAALLLLCLPGAAQKPGDLVAEEPLRSPDRRWTGMYAWSRPSESLRRGSLVVWRTGSKRRVIYSVMSDGQGFPMMARWSPDSKRILFWTYEAGSSSANADGSPLYDIRPTGGRPRRLSSFMMRNANCVQFSPNGRYLLLVDGGGRFMVSNKRLLRIDYYSGRRKRLTGRDIAAVEPRWSPDGAAIAYTATPDTYELGDTFDIERRWKRMHLWVMRADGSSKRQLASDRHYHELAPYWVDGGRAIQFTRQENGGSACVSDWIIRADGKGLHQLSAARPRSAGRQ